MNAVVIINIIIINSLIKAQPAYLLISLSTDQSLEIDMITFKAVNKTLSISENNLLFLSSSCSFSFLQVNKTYIIEWKCLDDKPNAKHICNMLCFPIYLLLKVQILLLSCSADAKCLLLFKRWFHVTRVTLCLYERDPEHLNPAQGFKGQNSLGALIPFCSSRRYTYLLMDFYALFIFLHWLKKKKKLLIFFFFLLIILSHKGAMTLEAFHNVFAWPALVKCLPVSQELSLNVRVQNTVIL